MSTDLDQIVRRLKTQVPGGLKRTKFPPIGTLGVEEDNDFVSLGREGGNGGKEGES